MMVKVRGAVHPFPPKAVADGDASNGFGSVRRAEGVELVLAKVPVLAPLLAAIWQVMPLTLWLNDGAGEWTR